MTALDIFTFSLLGFGGIYGFMRGFVHEVLALISWVAMIFAVRLFHTPLSEYLTDPVGTQSGAAMLAFILLVAISFGLGKLVARKMGTRTKASVLGPVDRVLGFGFGVIKGLIGATLIFLLLLMVVELFNGGDAEKPEWMTQSNSFPMLNASGNAISEFAAERRKASQDKETEDMTEEPAI
ncbi:colicin V production protein [Sphingorhabdus lutea]|uniref:Colicin V production protein n=1 Tax=Sphingorhabdus lutea TaxID=1913578 RepID=A0A1L3JFA6_9SPHN|nr:CvpA family protein [Sphingorhabdus lutea]APG63779.1 colicin V production protein [Sphingorhabdus lutea]